MRILSYLKSCGRVFRDFNVLKDIYSIIYAKKAMIHTEIFPDTDVVCRELDLSEKCMNLLLGMKISSTFLAHSLELLIHRLKIMRNTFISD